MSIAGSLLIAMIVEAVLSWPTRLHAVIGHPVSWLGHLIEMLETRFNNHDASFAQRRLAGTGVAVATILCAGIGAWAVTPILPGGFVGWVLIGLLAWPLIATRSMYDHVAAVSAPLIEGNLADARAAVAKIVGRDPDQLDESGVARAALESLAENTSDGVVAPIFWGLVLGLPGMAAYKAINTLDSMIGHRTPRYEAFGWAAARIDDVVNLIPARLTGLVFVMISGQPTSAWTCMWRDAGQHRSPNAGWPEAAMAGALKVRLSGPRAYEGGRSDEPYLNPDARDADAADLKRGLALFVRAMLLLAAILAILAVI